MLTTLSIVFVLVADCYRLILFFFFFNDTATTEIYTLSLHDALPIWRVERRTTCQDSGSGGVGCHPASGRYNYIYVVDRKSTRLNSSHSQISYAVFCLKKKKKKLNNTTL